jgi:hypothetical protein
MTILTLNQEQTKLVKSAVGPVEVRDAEGRVVTRIEPPAREAETDYVIPNEAELIAAALRARGTKQPKYTSEQVRAHLRALDDAAARGASEDELRSLSERLLDEAAAG